MVPTLYELCLDNLISNSAYIEDLTSVSFHPYILDLLALLFDDRATCDLTALSRRVSSSSVNITNLLARIADAHGATLSKPEYIHFGSLQIGCHGIRQTSQQLTSLSKCGAPHFLTRLDLSMAWVKDDDLILLKGMVHLTVLDLTNTLVTDYGVSHLARLTLHNLQHLKILSLAYNENITDGSLRFIRKIQSLCGIDLSTTNVTPSVATYCLKDYNYICNTPIDKPEHQQPYLKHVSKVMRTRLQQQQQLTDDQQKILNRASLTGYVSDTSESERYSPIRLALCPPHEYTLITYETMTNNKMTNRISNPGHSVKKNCHLRRILTGEDPYEVMTLNQPSWRTWWRNPSRQQPLVFTRSFPFTENNPTLDRKRPATPISTYTNSSAFKGPLTVKRTKTALSVVNDFQW